MAHDPRAGEAARGEKIAKETVNTCYEEHLREGQMLLWGVIKIKLVSQR